MFQTLKNAWSMPELRKKILYTLFIILIFRFGSCIPVPFIDTQLLAQYFEQASTNGSMLGYLDMFSGGGLSRATIFAMSITPYINASIILQLLTVAIPALERMVKDGGEEGRKKIASWTRYVGVLLGLLQGLSYYALLRNQGFLSDKGVLAAVTIIMTFTAGTALIMWMGEHITQKGIGNGISIILFAGIVSRGPSLMRTLGNLFQTGTSGIVSAILMIIIGIFIVVFIVFMSNAERRIPVQYAKRVVGRKMYGGQSTHLPIKVNASGVMPIIFASSILALPQTVSMFWQPEAGTVGAHILNLFSQRSVVYIVLYALLMIVIIGGMFAAMSFMLCKPFVGLGLDWLYFDMMTLMALFLGVFGGVFPGAQYAGHDRAVLWRHGGGRRMRTASKKVRVQGQFGAVCNGTAGVSLPVA